jgi:hypothetical protein
MDLTGPNMTKLNDNYRVVDVPPNGTATLSASVNHLENPVVPPVDGCGCRRTGVGSLGLIVLALLMRRRSRGRH